MLYQASEIGKTDPAVDAHGLALEGGKTCLDEALRLLGMGWPVLALCPPDHVGVGRKHGRTCKSPGKAPLVAWKAYQDELPTEEEVRRWWEWNPLANLGVALGNLVRLVGIDSDGEGGEEMVRGLARGELPTTLEFTSGGGGRRRLYLIPAGVNFRPTHQPGGEKHEGFSILGHGSQTVLPPSRHPSGGRYSWVSGRGPGEIQPALSPHWLVEFMTSKRKAGRSSRATPLADGEALIEGTRNATLTSLAGSMRRRGMSERAILAALEVANKEQCEPPLEGEEVQKIAKSVARYAPDPKASASVPIRGPDAQAQSQGETQKLPEGGGKKQPTQSEVLLGLATGAEYFHATDGNAFATMPVDDAHRETAAVRSKVYRNWLSRAYYLETGKAPSAKNLLDVIGVLEARARYDGKALPVYHRVGGVDGECCLDLCSPCRRSVVIDKDGWRLTHEAPVRLRRPPTARPLPEPIRGGSLDELRPFINIRGEDWPLVVGWLVQALRLTGPYPILCLHGEQGSAKSTAARALRGLIDPSSISLRAEPRDVRDLAIAANNSWILALDNLSFIEPWLSDALCRLSTGGGFATRELYSDGEEVAFDFQRPLILNGIEDVATRADLLDRAIVLHLPAITEAGRLPESVFWKRFEQARPRILGALLDAVSAAFRNLPSITLDRLPRMADFACWVSAAEPALPWPPGTFLKTYGANRADAVDMALDASPAIPPLREFLEQATSWCGTCQELLDNLNRTVSEQQKKSKQWPASARALSGILRRLAPCLRAIGVHVEFGQRGKKGRPLSLRLEPKEARGNSDAFDRHHIHHRHQPGENQAEEVTVAPGGDGRTVTNARDRHPETAAETSVVTVGDGGVGVLRGCSPSPDDAENGGNCPF